MIFAGVALKIRVELLGTAVEALAVMTLRNSHFAPLKLFNHAGHGGEQPQVAPGLVSAG